MEFPDFPLEIPEPLYDFLSPPVHRESAAIKKKADWSSEENKMFENALAELDPTSQSFFEDIASKIPRMTIEEIKDHYLALIVDIEMIECGEIPIPNYRSNGDTRDRDIIKYRKGKHIEMEMTKENIAGGSSAAAACSNAAAKTRQSSQKGVPWTEEEHQLFLMGLHRYGKGNWRSISRYYVITKTPTQVASHAQKYFKRLTSTTPIERRRPSIHDIKTVNPTTFAVPPIKLTDQGGNNVCLGKIQENPLILLHNFLADSSSHAQNIYPSLNLHNYTSNGDGSTMNNSRMFSPINYSSAGAITFSSADPIVNQTSGVANHPRSAICSFSSMSRNQ